MAQRKGDRYLQLLVLSLSFTAVAALYFTADYYMDQSMSRTFGGYCGERVEDACLYINSHFQFFGLIKYEANKDCTFTIDAGTMGGALYKLQWQQFELQPGDCSADYLEIYDADWTAMNSSNKIGKFCGNFVNTTGYPTQRYVTFVFKTVSGGYPGFKVRAVRYEPLPCQDEEFECQVDSICIDSRLKCDGTQQCSDGEDETGCLWWEKLVGGFLALGIGGMATVGGSVMIGCIGIWVVCGAFTCCKKCCANLCSCCPCACCKKCCRVPDGRSSAKVRPGTGASMKSDYDGMELAEVEDDDHNLPPKPDSAYTNDGYYDDLPPKPDTADNGPEVVVTDNEELNGKQTTVTRIGSSHNLQKEPTNLAFE